MSCFGFRQGLALVVQPLFHPLPGLTYFLCLAKEAGCWWCILCFVPWRGRLTFFVLPKKVSKERRHLGQEKQTIGLHAPSGPCLLLRGFRVLFLLRGYTRAPMVWPFLP
ncbi:ferrisiderophore receptor signal peptide protein [Ralstonia solanacearum]|nr:ferrisiderophore receptor signal peptide protein [Ralstonia solanacearum]